MKVSPYYEGCPSINRFYESSDGTANHSAGNGQFHLLNLRQLKEWTNQSISDGGMTEGACQSPYKSNNMTESNAKQGKISCQKNLL